jgi:hypothetical protein
MSGAPIEDGTLLFHQTHKKFVEQPSEQPFDQNKNGSQFGCLASY